jgi:uncharacterized membrane protein YeaQ/YmgE (transglycosylase-associated protein family)
MALIFWIIAGIVAGALAKRGAPGEGAGGAVGDLMTGVIGALAGSCLFQKKPLAAHGNGVWRLQ